MLRLPRMSTIPHRRWIAIAAWLLMGVGVSVRSQTAPSVQQTNDEFVKAIAAQIAGRENQPAGEVFKNVQFLKATRASTFLLIMNAGYSKALGVTCTHCHDEHDFASDDKRAKKAAREMQTMHRGINEQLRGMSSLRSDPDNRAISCVTCHRGQAQPFRG
jgi:hypothetical protein